MNKIRKLVRQLIIEEMELAGFHGWGMAPKDLARGSLLSICNSGWISDSKNDPGGCPLFSASNPISDKDLELAASFLNEEQPDQLIVYSRGSAILCQVLKYEVFIPKSVVFVAPAWKRWGSISTSMIAKKLGTQKTRVIIGEMDPKVPVKHAYELASLLGAKLEILPACDHATGKDYAKGGLASVGKVLVEKVPELFKDLETPKCKYGALKYIWSGLTGQKTITPKSPASLPEWSNDSYANEEIILQQIEAIRG